MVNIVHGYRAAARTAGVSIKTIERWKRQGLKHYKTSTGETTFQHKHLLAWRRYKLLTNPALQTARSRLQAQGRAPVLSTQEIAKILHDYKQAGGQTQ